ELNRMSTGFYDSGVIGKVYPFGDLVGVLKERKRKNLWCLHQPINGPVYRLIAFCRNLTNGIFKGYGCYSGTFFNCGREALLDKPMRNERSYTVMNSYCTVTAFDMLEPISY